MAKFWDHHLAVMKGHKTNPGDHLGTLEIVSDREGIAHVIGRSNAASFPPAEAGGELKRRWDDDPARRAVQHKSDRQLDFDLDP